MPFLKSSSVVALGEYWIIYDHGSWGGDFHPQAKCLCNRTMFGSIPLGGYGVWHEEIPLLSAFELKHHQALCSGHSQTLCASSSERNPGTIRQLVLPVNRLHRRLGNCISWRQNWDQYLVDAVGSWRAHLDKILTLAV